VGTPSDQKTAQTVPKTNQITLRTQSKTGSWKPHPRLKLVPFGLTPFHGWRVGSLVYQSPVDFFTQKSAVLFVWTIILKRTFLTYSEKDLLQL